MQAQLSAVTQAIARGVGDGATVARLKGLIEETQAGIHGLDASIEIQRMKQTRIAQTHLPAEIPDRSTEIRSARETTSASNTFLTALPTSGVAQLAKQDQEMRQRPSDGSAEPLLIEDAGVVPTGWMGDAAEKGSVEVDPRSTEKPHSPPSCQRWTYIPKPSGAGWAAIAWQFSENNWGDTPGKDWSKRGFTQVTVWARGVRDRHGKLPIVQFKAGGGTDPTKKYPASFEVEGGFVTLSEEWKHYLLNLRGKNLSQVIAAFTMVFRAEDAGSERATVYLDDIEYRQAKLSVAFLLTAADSGIHLDCGLWPVKIFGD